jgi:hypothetical protein
MLPFLCANFVKAKAAGLCCTADSWLRHKVQTAPIPSQRHGWLVDWREPRIACFVVTYSGLLGSPSPCHLWELPITFVSPRPLSSGSFLSNVPCSDFLLRIASHSINVGLLDFPLNLATPHDHSNPSRYSSWLHTITLTYHATSPHPRQRTRPTKTPPDHVDYLD